METKLQSKQQYPRSVSYTHLDVYKRQDGHFAEIQKAQDKEQTTEQAQPAQEAAKQPETKAAAPELPEETAPVQEMCIRDRYCMRKLENKRQTER